MAEKRLQSTESRAILGHLGSGLCFVCLIGFVTACHLLKKQLDRFLGIRSHHRSELTSDARTFFATIPCALSSSFAVASLAVASLAVASLVPFEAVFGETFTKIQNAISRARRPRAISRTS